MSGDPSKKLHEYKVMHHSPIHDQFYLKKMSANNKYLLNQLNKKHEFPMPH